MPLLLVMVLLGIICAAHGFIVAHWGVAPFVASLGVQLISYGLCLQYFNTVCKPSTGTSTSGGTTKPAATKTPAPAPAATPAPTAKPQVKYTFTVRRHEATCTTQGYDEHICHEWGGMNYNDRFVPAKGHSWDGGTVTKAATYTETGIKTFKCKECDETRTEEIPSLDKTYHIKSVVAPTCTAEGYTIYECNEVPGLTYKGDYKAKLPHAYDTGKVTKPATIYEKGTKTFTCTSCGITYTEDIPVVEKTWHKGNTVAPTCTEKGYTIYICDQDSALTEKRDYTNALGHASTIHLDTEGIFGFSSEDAYQRELNKEKHPSNKRKKFGHR